MNDNLGPEPIRKKMGLDSGKPSMKLPRQDDGKIHKAVGEQSPTSASRFADAMTGFGAEAAEPGMKQDSGR